MSKERLRVLGQVDALDIGELIDGKTIEEVLMSLQALQGKYEPMILGKGYDVRFEIDYYGYDGGFDVSLHVYRDENDKEYEARMKQEEKERERKRIAKEKKQERARKILMETEAAEKAEYERLRAKYEKQGE